MPTVFYYIIPHLEHSPGRVVKSGRVFYLCGVGLLIYGYFPPAPVRIAAGGFRWGHKKLC